MKRWYFSVLPAAVFIIVSVAAIAAADEQDRARQAYQAGEVVELAQILGRVKSRFEGKMLEIELDERRSNRRSPWVYTVKMLTPRGNVITIQLNAKTMEVLDVKGRGADAARKRR
jgi:uncharacterized membrane protein YkoI